MTQQRSLWQPVRQKCQTDINSYGSGSWGQGASVDRSGASGLHPYSNRTLIYKNAQLKEKNIIWQIESIVLQEASKKIFNIKKRSFGFLKKEIYIRVWEGKFRWELNGLEETHASTTGLRSWDTPRLSTECQFTRQAINCFPVSVRFLPLLCYQVVNSLVSVSLTAKW